MLRDSTAVAVVVVRTRPRAMVHMRKSIHGFPSVPLYGYGAPLGGLRPPELRHDKSLVDFKNVGKKEIAWSETTRDLRLKSDKQRRESN